MNTSLKLQHGKFIVNKKRKRGKRSRVRFILDPLYCKQCPDRLYQCLKQAEKFFGIQIYNGTKLIIIEYAACIDIDDANDNHNISTKHCKDCYFYLTKSVHFVINI